MLKVLGLYAAMTPKRKIERHVILKPQKPTIPPGYKLPTVDERPEMKLIINKINSPTHYAHLVRDSTEDKFGSDKYGEPAAPKVEPEVVDTFAPEFQNWPKKKPKKGCDDELAWNFELRDTPIAGGKGIVTQRGYISFELHDDNPFDVDGDDFMGSWGWEYENSLFMLHYKILTYFSQLRYGTHPRGTCDIPWKHQTVVPSIP
jgi:hypothetical protein